MKNMKFIILVVVFFASLLVFGLLSRHKSEDRHKGANFLRNIIFSIIACCITNFVVPDIHLLDLIPNMESNTTPSIQDELEEDASQNDVSTQQDDTENDSPDSYDPAGYADDPSEGVKKEDLFSMAFLSTDSTDTYDCIEFTLWDSQIHQDLRGESYKETKNYYLSLGNTFNALTDNSSSLSADIHLTLNPSCKGEKNFSGDVVVESQSAGSTSSAEITILVDGELVWTCPETMTGTTVEPQHFDLNLTNAATEVIIRVESTITQQGINLGFVNLVDSVT